MYGELQVTILMVELWKLELNAIFLALWGFVYVDQLKGYNLCYWVVYEEVLVDKSVEGFEVCFVKEEKVLAVNLEVEVVRKWFSFS